MFLLFSCLPLLATYWPSPINLVHCFPNNVLLLRSSGFGMTLTELLHGENSSAATKQDLFPPRTHSTVPVF